MSAIAMAWAFRQHLPAAHKLTLIVLADNADPHGVGRVNTALLVRQTGLSEAVLGDVYYDLSSDGFVTPSSLGLDGPYTLTLGTGDQ